MITHEMEQNDIIPAMTSGTPEVEMPFTNFVTTIANEIIEDIDPSKRRYVEEDAQKLVRRYIPIPRGIPYEDRANLIEVIADKHAGESPHETIAVALIMFGDLPQWENWEPIDKRYLLDSGLTTTLLIAAQPVLDRDDRIRTYYRGSVNSSQINERITKLNDYITKLRERGNPTNPRMRR